MLGIRTTKRQKNEIKWKRMPKESKWAMFLVIRQYQICHHIYWLFIIHLSIHCHEILLSFLSNLGSEWIKTGKSAGTAGERRAEGDGLCKTETICWTINVSESLEEMWRFNLSIRRVLRRCARPCVSPCVRCVCEDSITRLRHGRCQHVSITAGAPGH